MSGTNNTKAWSAKREAAFVDAVNLNGKEVSVLEIPAGGTVGASAAPSNLRKWLLGLEKPCGLFAADDTLAAMALSICRISGISVPDELAVIGVDDNESVCDHTVPTLTSIRPDFLQGGRFAARLLARKILKARNVPKETVFSVAGLTKRGSTRMFRRKDQDVAAALERIHAPDGVRLTPKEILAAFPCSRRSAEIRFRQATGRSILDELVDARIALAKSLLAETNLPVSSVAERCGYRFQTQFRKIFLRATGRNPLRWRQDQVTSRGASRCRGCGREP